MKLSDNYIKDIEYYYYVGGYQSSDYRVNYTRQIKDITDFDDSILVAGNVDNDFINKMSESLEKMLSQDLTIVDNSDNKIRDVVYRGTCIVSGTNASASNIYNLTTSEIISGYDMSTARFCLGNDDLGFQTFCVIPSGNTLVNDADIHVDNNTRQPQTTQGVLLYNDSNDIIEYKGDIRFILYNETEWQKLNFDNEHKPYLYFIFDSSVGRLLVSFSKVTQSFQYENTIKPPQDGWILGSMSTEDFTNYSTDTERPSFKNHAVDNSYGLIIDRRYYRRWYLDYFQTISNKLASRLFNITGLYYFPHDVVNRTDYETNVYLGTRDDNNNIPQDAYNKGISAIKENDKYSSLKYDELPETKHILPDSDEIDSMLDIEGMTYTGGYNLYALTSGELYDITHTELPTGFDLSSCILSLNASTYNLNTFISTSRETPFATRNTVLSEDNYTYITSVHQCIDLATFFVQGINGNYLDYAPYSSYEIYIPCCGWIQLTDFVVNKTIDVKLAYDINTGSCKAYIFADGLEIATKTGSFMSSIPVTINGSGMLKNAYMSSSLNMAGGVLSLVSGVVTGNPISMSMGALSCANSISQSVVTSNTNYNTCVGATGDNSDLSDYSNIEFKISYSKPNTDISSTYGKPLNSYETLNTLSGFTMIDSFNTDGLSCMESEKIKIKTLFENGVIL